MGDYTDLEELECSQVASVIPSIYRLSIFDIDLQEPWAYSGEVKINANISHPSDTINIHADNLNIQAAVVDFQDGNTMRPDQIHILKEKQLASLHFPSILPHGEISLAICFQGIIDESMRGFYRTKYQSNNKCSDEHMLVTQFEPCSARKAFPCFDEPYLKASFELTVETAEHLSVLSNMPFSSEEIVVKDSATMKRTVFEMSPIMSTYLLAWAIGNFEHIETYTERKHFGKQVPVRLYATPGLIQHGQFALDYACKVLDFFADVFGIDYPLPKSDHLIAHDFIGGAMENWGLIVYKPTKILFEPGACDNRVKNKAAYVVAHELAHQWFGNLVTLSDWDELWLNEGFATWAGYLAMDHILPDWRAWDQFHVEVMEEAFALDGLRSTHPIKNRIDDALAASQAFDSISYFKGASVIRMLCNCLGSDTFFRGVQNYLKRHKYGNATSQDLWDALADKSGFDVAKFMDSWLHEPGYPVVKVEGRGAALEISQEPWLSSDDGCRPITWNIPLTGDALGPLLPTTAEPKKIDVKLSTINDGRTGFYRIFYPSTEQEALFAAKTAPRNKAGLIADVFALSYANQKPISEFLACVWHLSDETDPFIWQQVSASFSTINSIFASDIEISRGLRAYLTDLSAKIIKRVDWQVESGQYLEVELKKIILNFAETFDHPAVIAEAQHRFEVWRDNGIPLDGNLLLLVFSSVLAHVDERKAVSEAYKEILRCYQDIRAVGGKELCLRALGRVCDPELILDLVKLSISPNVSLQDAPVLAAALGRNPVARPIVWQFMKSHWTEIEAALSSNDRAFSPWVQESLSSFTDLDCLEDINRFFEHKRVPMLAKGLNIVREMITKNALFKIHQEDGLRQWLKANGHLE